MCIDVTSTSKVSLERLFPIDRQKGLEKDIIKVEEIIDSKKTCNCSYI